MAELHSLISCSLISVSTRLSSDSVVLTVPSDAAEHTQDHSGEEGLIVRRSECYWYWQGAEEHMIQSWSFPKMGCGRWHWVCLIVWLSLLIGWRERVLACYL